jgi:hypothetical protein
MAWHPVNKSTGMRNLIFVLLAVLCLKSQAQNKLTNNIIEGSRVFVDLLRVIKSPKNTVMPASPAVHTLLDSCATKSLGDVCYKNASGKTIFVSLYKRSGNSYAAVPLSLAILNNTKECVYEIQSGIYKYKIEYENDDEKRTVYKEGEIKIEACDKKQEEIK